MLQGELVISYVETKNAQSYLKDNEIAAKERSMLKSKDHFLSSFFPIGDCHFWSRFAIRLIGCGQRQTPDLEYNFSRQTW